MTLSALPDLPPRLRGRHTSLPSGRWAGRLREDPADFGPGGGRLRRWYYVAAGGEQASVGAAVVDLGVLAVSFAWALIGARTLTWQRRIPLGRGAWVGAVPDGGAGALRRGQQVVLHADGSLELDVPTDAGRLRASVTTHHDVTPAVLVTRTPNIGWNVTQKSAGTAVEGWVRVGDGPRTPLGMGASGWRDWTAGRQDRATTWRWAAGGGWCENGQRVGLNASTGMNGRELGEDVVWWEGIPYGLSVAHLRPADELDAEGAWDVGGPGWSLHLDPAGFRSEDLRIGPLVSRYVQPIGRFEGTLPGPEGTARRVWLSGVTEDHEAKW